MYMNMYMYVYVICIWPSICLTQTCFSALSAYCLVGYFDIAWILPYTGCATIPLQSMFNAPALHHCVVIRT